MIRKLFENDRDLALEFLMEESTFNLFIIGDIINTGFGESYMDLWGEFDEYNEIVSLLLRYYNNFIPYYKDSYRGSLHCYKKIISGSEGKKLILGKSEIVDCFTDVLDKYKLKKEYLCELKDSEKLLTNYGVTMIKKATLHDVDRISDFIDTIDEFGQTGENRDMLENNINKDSGRVYYIEDENGNIISCAATSAESKYAAMIVSVATDKNHRKQGLASKCVSKLCIDTFQDCAKMCLFYDNPEAGSIYHRLGFNTIGNWSMVIEI